MNKDKQADWSREPGVHEISLRGKKYKNLVMFTRPCAACNTRFPIYVSQRVADGYATNNNFGLRNCEVHRSSATDKAEVQALRTANITMRSELNGLYGRNKLLFEELQQCKARLSLYELGPALDAHASKIVAPGKQDTSPSGIAPKMPWD